MWARFLKERFGAKKADSMKLRTLAQTAGVSLTAQQPYNNVVRVALQALAAVLGGTQSLHTNSLDETYALPTEVRHHRAPHPADHRGGERRGERHRPARRQLLPRAPHRRARRQALAIIQRIDDMGGMVAAIEKGYPQRGSRRAPTASASSSRTTA